MKMVKIVFASMIFFVFAVMSCKKNSNNGPFSLSYGDSIIYLKNQSTDHIVYPTEQRGGTYTAFPDGIDINEQTGAINVTKSETGLRYRITYSSPNGETSTTTVVLSGITYFDR